MFTQIISFGSIIGKYIPSVCGPKVSLLGASPVARARRSLDDYQSPDSVLPGAGRAAELARVVGGRQNSKTTRAPLVTALSVR